ncbi:PREDICTED: bidirectional sugar transporter SWEET14-like [Erythranthe guttata]|uniref:bidirectional sugar transporter SWEET14-like n=1 Tax=Erythranthe guttata TaxID=4155 RepID=UPI00064D9996|nr:PREDICTED: bidirectional sugar transporter SWEET14-like [Erythranthe guttata]|eukprot:XP_012853196.1 PREDICTED: bidirectional sugar transporter SWEET14-like [Erythranthe guttata]
MLWIYYAFLKSNTTLLITINSVGCLIETVYILLFIFYASKKARVETVKLLALLMVCGTGLVGVTQFVVKASERANVVGWFCLILSLCVFIAPLCIVIPNVLGFSFGVLQMVLYGLYKHANKIEKQEQIMVGKEQQKSPEITETIIKIVKRKALLSSPEKIPSSKNGVEASLHQNLPKEIEV